HFPLSRRAFGQGTALTAGLLGTGLPLVEPAPAPAAAPHFTHHSPALQPDPAVARARPFSHCHCRLQVGLQPGRLLEARGEEREPVQAGEVCVKASLMTQLVYNRLRLTRPLKRVGGEKGSPESKFAPISWDDALEIIARKLLSLRDGGETRAVASKTSGRLP